MGNRMRCSLLCEDVEQERFFRPILERVFGTRVNVEARKPAGGAPFVMAQLPTAPAEVDAEKNTLPALSAARAEINRVLKLV